MAAGNGPTGSHMSLRVQIDYQELRICPASARRACRLPCPLRRARLDLVLQVLLEAFWVGSQRGRPAPVRPPRAPTASLRQSINRITASPFIPHPDQVRGFVFDVAIGKLN